ncbi:MAG: twin-arginine translocation signal domain-containing protein [Nitrososphaerales archaeon]
MPESQQSVENDSEKKVESRRTFLKTSVAAGAAVAVLATGAHFLPTMTSAAMSANANNKSGSSSAINSNDPLVVIVKGEKLDVYQGENKYPIDDSSLARQITSNLKSRI